MKFKLALIIVFVSKLFLSQTLQGAKLKPCITGTSYSLMVEEADDCETPKPFNYYFRHNADINCDSVIDYGNSYELLGRDQKGAQLILLKKEYENSQKKYRTYNLNTGKLIFEVDDYLHRVNYIENDLTFLIVGGEPWGSTLLSANADTILHRNNELLNHCSLGYYYRDSREDETFYNAKGKEIKEISDFSLFEQVGPNDFLGGRTHEETNYEAAIIIDSTGKLLYRDKCGWGNWGYWYNPITDHKTFYMQGLCEIDDSHTILTKIKGKWKTPLYKLSEEVYITYILPLNIEGHYVGPDINGKTPYYYTSEGYGESHIRDKKGNPLIKLSTGNEFHKIVIDDQFIYCFKEELFSLYKTSGEALLTNTEHSKYSLTPESQSAGYFAFINSTYEYPEIYIYNIKTDELKFFYEREYDISTLEELEKTFNKLEAITVDQE